jgi:ATPase subunit of ABC transporter with duplicated ATPase domains
MTNYIVSSSEVSMLTLSGVIYRIGGRALLDQASAQIADGSKVGLVGRNGVGKSTLLDLIRGALQPDGGTIELPRGHRIGFLAQEAPSGGATPLMTVLAADSERHGAAARRRDREPARRDRCSLGAEPGCAHPGGARAR